VINALYDLKEDPHEMYNLIGNNPERKKFEAKASELREDMLTWLKEHKSSHYDGVKARDLMKSDLTTGMSQIPLKQFRIFPNPTSGQVTIDSYAAQIRGIEIYNLNGQKIYSNNQSFTGMQTVDLPSNSGLCLIKLTGEYPFLAQKIMVE
jgi:hypothetical protein